MGNRNWTIQRNWQHMVHKKTKQKTKTQHTQTTQTRHQPPTNNRSQRRTEVFMRRW